MEKAQQAGDKPTQEQLVNEFLAAIASGQLQPGDALPSEQRLADDRGINRITVGRVYRHLRDVEGAISIEHRVGASVRAVQRMTWQMTPPSRPAADPWHAVPVRDKGHEQAEVKKVRAATRVGNYTLADLLGIDAGDRVISRPSLRTLSDGTPIEATTAYYAETLVRDSPLDDPGSNDDPHDVLRDLGQPVTGGHQELNPRMPNPAERKALRLQPATPVVDTITRSLTAEGRCVEVRHSIYVGGPGRTLIYILGDAPASSPQS